MSEQIVVPQALSMAVTVHDRQAVLHLSQPREYVAMMPAEALQMGARMFTAAVEASPDAGQAGIAAAMAVIDAIYELRGDLKPAGGAVKHELIERHRATLLKRIEVVLNSERDKRKVSNAAMARGLVDIMLSEVFS
jgi:hypothetical protein